MRSPSVAAVFAVTALALTSALAACGSPRVFAPPPERSAHLASTSGAIVPSAPVLPTTPAPPPLDLADLHEGQAVRGWLPTAVYVDDDHRPRGARLVHQATGFTLDYLRIESAPQGFLWVTSFPTSDKGEPHTQEHLLLGKGDRGRKMGSFQSMWLAESSAFTDQWHTAYHFHTVAGHDAFWPVMEDQLGALLFPDYTDDEIRREVRNFGVDKDSSGALHLEEKGTVYNEMVRSYEDPAAVLWRTALQLVYGTHHPLAYESGGFPDAIRTMTPTDIRTFHDAAYHLSTMGMVGAFPSAMHLGDVLDQTSSILGRAAARMPKDAPAAAVASEAQLPRPAAAPAGTIRVVEYPYSDTKHPGPMLLAWPATRDLSPADHELLAMFVAQLAGDESTVLYKQLIDSKSRVLDTGATALSGDVSWEQGQPVRIELDGIRADKLDQATAAKVRGVVTAELQRIARLPDGSPELAAIAHRIDTRIVDRRRNLLKFLDTPPGFGTRGTGPGWLDFLDHLQHTPGFTKSLTLAQALTEASAAANGQQNPWRTRLAAWGLLDAPYVVVARPSPAARARLDADRTARNAAELVRLEAQYKLGAAETLAAYARDEDAKSAVIEGAARKTDLPPLVAHPPMTLDDDLAYTTAPVAGLPALRATFPGMASAEVVLAFRLDAVAADDLVYLAMLPAVLRDAGVLDGDKPLSAAEVDERRRREILTFDVGYEAGVRTGRTELVVRGAGLDASETTAALGWIARGVLHPDLRPANVARLRDLVAQAIVANRGRMQGAEETWVEDPRDAWQHQDRPLWLHTASFLTRAHDLHRLRWMLEDAGDPKANEAAAAAIDRLADAGAAAKSSAELAAIAARVAGDAKAPPSRFALAIAPPHAAQIVRDAGADLAALVGELPDATRAADWSYLCHQMAHDLRAGAPAALAGLERVREAVVAASNARLVLVGSREHLGAIAVPLAQLTGQLDRRPRARVSYAGARAIETRLREHDPAATGAPLYVGLVDRATSSGVFLDAAPAPGYDATSDAEALDVLASATYSGHGAHSMFMKTWAAGLAYSNGLHPQPEADRLEYYAERCPRLSQTISFVIAQLRAQKADANIARYAVARMFDSRVAAPYEDRAERMASDLADGIAPAMVRAFRSRVLAIAARPDLPDALFARMPVVYGHVLPGLGAPVPAATYFVIGPDAQLASYRDYLAHEAGGAALHELYPRDYWAPATL